MGGESRNRGKLDYGSMSALTHSLALSFKRAAETALACMWGRVQGTSLDIRVYTYSQESVGCQLSLFHVSHRGVHPVTFLAISTLSKGRHPSQRLRWKISISGLLRMKLVSSRALIWRLIYPAAQELKHPLLHHTHMLSRQVCQRTTAVKQSGTEIVLRHAVCELMHLPRWC